MASTVQLSERAFVTKEEVREAIFSGGDVDESERTDDELNTLYRMINWVCDAVENRLGGPIIQQTKMDYSDGGSEYVFLTSTPIVSVTSVEEVDSITSVMAALTADVQYKYDPSAGAIRRLSDTDATIASTFTSGPLAVKITYLAGYGTQNRDGSGELISVSNVPEDFKLAAYLWIKHLWQTGPANFTPEQGVATGSRAAIPFEVKEILITRPTGVHWIGE